MELRKSERKRAKIKMALQAPSGAGKTYSSLLIAEGLLEGDLSKVAVIDSENGSADLYAHLGSYNIVNLNQFSPEDYIKAINLCEESDMKVIIIDSLSHCWNFLLDYHNTLSGNSFTNWSKITPRHKALIDKILQCDMHVIATMRTKQDYVLNQKDGKYIPEKIGLKAVQREGMDYEFTLVFDLDVKHLATSSKDRTGLFMDNSAFKISVHTGKKILNWCNSGTNLQDARVKIKECLDIEVLRKLYAQYSIWRELLEFDFKQQKDYIYNKSANTLENKNNTYEHNQLSN